MMNKFVKKVIFAIIMLTSFPAYANNYGYLEEGIKAIRNGNYNTAYNILQPLALQGNPEAQFNLCGMYFQAQGVPKNDVEAARWCHAAALNAHIEAMYNLGLFYQEGSGVGQNLSEAKKWYQEAAYRGHDNAKYNLAELNGSTINIAKAISTMPMPVPQPNPQATQQQIAPQIPQPVQMAQAVPQQIMAAPLPQQSVQPTQIPYSPAPKNVANLRASTAMASNNSVSNLNQLQPASGYIQTVKEETPPILILENNVEAIDPLTACIIAAQRGVVYDMCNEANKIEADSKSYQVASLKPTTAKEVNAATKSSNQTAPKTKPHSFTLDTEGNFSTALEGAITGKADAQTNLATMYRKGEGVARNYPEAIKWFEKSASKGNVTAMMNLASMYQNGEGVMANPGLAYSWFNLAADRSQSPEQKKEAISKVQTLSKQLSNEEIGNALSFVNKLDEKIPPQI